MWTTVIWAATVLLIAVTAMLIFRGAIVGLVGRVKGGEVRGIKFQTSVQQNAPEIKTDPADLMVRALDSPVIKNEEDAIQEILAKAGVTDDAGRVKVLKRYLAATNLQLVFTRVTSLIYGSQIYVLEHLNTIRSGVSKDEIRRLFYEEAKARYPMYHEGSSFEAYVGFLKFSNLVSEASEMLHITDLGVEFLRFLAAIGRSTDRFRPG